MYISIRDVEKVIETFWRVPKPTSLRRITAGALIPYGRVQAVMEMLWRAKLVKSSGNPSDKRGWDETPECWGATPMDMAEKLMAKCPEDLKAMWPSESTWMRPMFGAVATVDPLARLEALPTPPEPPKEEPVHEMSYKDILKRMDEKERAPEEDEPTPSGAQPLSTEEQTGRPFAGAQAVEKSKPLGKPSD